MAEGFAFVAMARAPDHMSAAAPGESEDGINRGFERTSVALDLRKEQATLEPGEERDS